MLAKRSVASLFLKSASVGMLVVARKNLWRRSEFPQTDAGKRRTRRRPHFFKYCSVPINEAERLACLVMQLILQMLFKPIACSK
tara:strand:+ start:1586 stop:1837 length:252 start_codon:yes stop_codon:yes gene_type:complete